jgi:uncharacterized membrane protein YozB (DUF420 family)
MSSQASAVRRVTGAQERNFYLGMGLACALFIVAGFAPTYFLSPFIERPAYAPPLSIYLHLHAGIFTAWLLLFVTQTALVRADRRELHRRLGVLGLVVAIAIVTINFMTVIEAIDSGRASPVGPPIPRLYLALSASLLAGGFVFAGLYWRRNPAAHKRLMLVATISMMGPAMNRFTRQFDLTTLLDMDRVAIALTATLALYGVCMLNDYRTQRRVHPVYLIGAGIVMASRALAEVVPATAAWQKFASWVLG